MTKCYLCERRITTDFEIEHHKSKKHHKNLIQDWNNLFIACKYCNGKKLDDFDDSLHPSSENIEEEISQIIDYDEGKAIFKCEIEGAAGLTSSITLLNRLFNGTNKTRKIKEQRFFDYAVGIINDFLFFSQELSERSHCA